MNRRIGAAMIGLLLLTGALVGSPTASASVPDQATARPDLPVAWDLATGGCACPKERAELRAFRDRILAAPTPEAARTIVISQTRLAHKALSRARWILPFSGTVRGASRKLEAYEARVREAKSQAEVAREWSTLTRMASADGGAIRDVKISGSCSYTTIEIVIIIIGFLLAIIPGILFLFLLC
jgi:hypothetical protein